MIVIFLGEAKDTKYVCVSEKREINSQMNFLFHKKPSAQFEEKSMT